MTKRRLLTAISGVALLAALQGCSSGGLSDGDVQGDELPPSGDAATDPVPPPGDTADLDKVAQATPQDGLEQPPPDPNAAPPDPNAAPPDPNAAPPAPAETPPDNVTPPPTVAETPPTPAGTAKETAPPPAETKVAHEGEGEYTVAGGDTLMKIAFEHYGDLYKWKEIFELNRDKITNPNSIPRGTVLKLNPGGEVSITRNGEKYLIKSGDTLGTISREVYGTSSKWKKIWKNNRELIKDPNRIFAGFYLYYTIEDGDKAPAVHSQPTAKEGGGNEEPPPSERGPASNAAAPTPTTPPPVGTGGPSG